MKKYYTLLLIIFTLNNALKAQWKQINGPFGGRINAIAISGNNVFAGTHSGGVFLSSNNGSNWDAVNTGLPANTTVNSLAISSSNIFAGTNSGVFLSTNNGGNWTAMNTGLPANTIINSLTISGSNMFAGTNNGVFLSTNNGGAWSAANTGLPAYGIFCLAISGNHIFAGTHDGVYLSEDNGSTWTGLNTYNPIGFVFSLVINGSNIFAGTHDGVYLSEDNGSTWTGLNTYNPIGFVFSLVINGSNIFAGIWAHGIYGNGVVRSSDNGNSWTTVNTGLTDSKVYSLAVNGNTIFAGTESGMFLSTDNGSTWTAAGTRLPSDVTCLNISGSTMYAGTQEGVYLSENNGRTWTVTGYYYHDNPGHSVNLLASNGNTIFAGTESGLFRSTNHGGTWTLVNIDISNVYSFAISGNMILAGSLGGIYLSTDNGSTWNKANTGLTGGLAIYSLVISGNNIFAGTDNGMYFSNNNGSAWTAVNTGLPANTNVYQLAASGSTIFAGTNNGVFLSTNNGNAWTPVNTGLPVGNSIHSLVTSGNSIFAGADNEVYFSNNNGSTWTAVNTGLPANTKANSLVISSSTVFASIQGSGIWKNTSLLCTPPAITIHASADRICAGSSVTLTGEGGTSYAWSGGVSNGIAFIPTGTTTYTVIGTDANNCSNTSVKTIIVNPLPAAVILQGNLITLYEPDSIELSATDSANFTYLWSTGATSQRIFVRDSGNYSITITNSYGCSATSLATTVKVLPLPYLITSVSQTCISPDSFCIPVTKQTTDTKMDSIIGYDITLRYNKNKVHPTGTITLNNALINSNYVTSAVYFNETVINVSLYLNGTAPANTFFKGTGNVLCVNFTKDPSFTSVDSVPFTGNIDESYTTTIKSLVLKPGVFRTYRDSVFRGKLVNWTNNAPISYTPGVNLITNIYGTDINCGNKTATPVTTPDENGNFTYSILQGKSVEVDRDIDNNTKVGVIHGGFLSGNDAQLGSYVITKNPIFQPSIYQIIALDVNTDGKVSAGDLTQIAQRTLAVIPEFTQFGKPKSKDWVFVSDSLFASSLRYIRSATYPNDDGIGFSKSHVPVVPSCLQIPFTNDNCPLILPATFKGIVLGDIDSSYQTLGLNPALNKTEVNKEGTVLIDLSNAVWNGNSADIPVYITPMAQVVHALDFKIQFNKSNLTYHSAIKEANYIEMLSNYYEDENAVGFTSYGGNQNYETGKALVSIRLSTSSKGIKATDFTSAIAFINGKPAHMEVVNVPTGIISSGNNVNMMNIYPNPFATQAVITFSDEQKNITLKITDVLGKEIKTINFTGKQLTLEKGEMKAGVYFMQVTNENKNVANSRIVVQ